MRSSWVKATGRVEGAALSVGSEEGAWDVVGIMLTLGLADGIMEGATLDVGA